MGLLLPSQGLWWARWCFLVGTVLEWGLASLPAEALGCFYQN